MAHEHNMIISCQKLILISQSEPWLILKYKAVSLRQFITMLDQQGRVPFKESSRHNIYNRKHLKRWAKIPITKQDGHIEKERK